MGASSAVLLMARAPRAGTVRRALEPVLGPQRCAALQAELIADAANWAAAVAPGAVYVAHEPADAGPELRSLLGPGPHLFPQSGSGIAGRVADASGRVLGGGGGMVVVIWPDLACWRPEHGAALADLRAGCDISLGPVFDGGFYMVAFARTLPSLALPEHGWRSADAISMAILAAHEAGLEVGLLRPERGLNRPADVRAALADPLTRRPIRAILAR